MMFITGRCSCVNSFYVMCGLLFDSNTPFHIHYLSNDDVRATSYIKISVKFGPLHDGVRVKIN